MTELLRNTPRDRSWHAWSGSTGDLERLAKLLRELIEKRRTEALKSWDANNPQERDSGAVETYRLERRNEVVNEASPNGRLWQDGDIIKGSLDDILRELDPRSFEMLCMGARFSRDGEQDFVAVSLMRTKKFRDQPRLGIAVNIASTDRDWTLSSFTQLRKEVSKDTPSWRFARSLPVRLLVSGSITLSVYLILLLLVAPVTSNWTFVWLVILSITAGNLTINDWTWNRFFPPIEISQSGKSAVWPRLTLLVSLFLSLPIGLLVNYLYSILTQP